MQQITGEFSQMFQPLLAAVTMDAIPFSDSLGWLTSSIFVAALVMVLILWFCRKATRDVKRVPSAMQNFVEFLIEFLYGQVEGIVGKKVAPRAFPLLATIFIFVLVSNWFGLMPGVGTVGFGPKSGFLTLDSGHHAPTEEKAHHPEHAPDAAHAHSDHVKDDHAKDDHSHVAATDHAADEAHDDHHKSAVRPLLRPATADMNMTLAIAFVFMLVWFWLTMSELGPWGFIKHTFGPKGGLKGIMGLIVAVIFFCVGVIEIVSIAFRPLSLSLRLYGNVFAGESLLHTMATIGQGWGPIGSFLSSVILPLPFYFLELLVGVLQAMVFALLCAVYIQLSTTHDEH